MFAIKIYIPLFICDSIQWFLTEASLCQLIFHRFQVFLFQDFWRNLVKILFATSLIEMIPSSVRARHSNHPYWRWMERNEMTGWGTVHRYLLDVEAGTHRMHCSYLLLTSVHQRPTWCHLKWWRNEWRQRTRNVFFVAVVVVASERVAATIHPGGWDSAAFIHGPSITRCVCHLTSKSPVNGPASWAPLEKSHAMTLGRVWS